MLLLNHGTKEFCCGGTTVLYPDCGGWLHRSIHMIKVYRTMHTNTRFYVKTNEIHIRSLVDSIVLISVSWIWWYTMVMSDVIICGRVSLKLFEKLKKTGDLADAVAHACILITVGDQSGPINWG